MAPSKKSKSGKSKPISAKTVSTAENNKLSRSGGPGKAQGTSKSQSSSKPSSSGQYKTAARRRPGRNRATRGENFGAFAIALALILFLGGGLVYALAPRGLDLMGWGKNSVNSALDSGVAGRGDAAKPYAMGGGAYEADENEQGASSSAAEGKASLSATDLENSIVRIDDILRQAMEQHGITPGSPRLVDVLPSLSGKANFLFQILNFSAEGSPAEQRAVVDRVMAELSDTLPKMLPPASLSQTSEDRWAISVAGTPTHELVFRQGYAEEASSEGAGASTEAARPSGAGTPGGSGRLVIIIDDIGENLGAAKQLAALKFPVTLAIWPRADHAAACAELAHAAGREVMVHQPMEPVSYPRNKPGPGAIFTSMRDAEIKALVESNLKLVPYAVGLNNHMGSKATLDARVIRDVLEALRGRGLFIVDSLTHDHSIFYGLARQAGFSALRRDIFLDNEQNVQSILHQLNTAARLAEKKGWAVAIGHPYPQTIAALTAWQSLRPAGLQIITAGELLGR